MILVRSEYLDGLRARIRELEETLAFERAVQEEFLWEQHNAAGAEISVDVQLVLEHNSAPF